MTLAWAGWLVRVPAHWQVLGVEGDWASGRFTAGVEAETSLQIGWQRLPRRPGFDPDEWLYRRSHHAAQGRDLVRGWPKPAGFSNTAWVTDGAGRRDEARPSNWYGYAPMAHLAIELTVQPELLREYQHELMEHVVPSLRAISSSTCSMWSVYDVAFVAPAGFAIVNWRLDPGDVALLALAADATQRLALRQTYPATEALAHRELAEWLRVPAFPTRRRLQLSAQPQPLQISSWGRTLTGLQAYGIRRLPFPLGKWRPVRTACAVAHDQELDRLLLVELDSEEDLQDELVLPSIESMNWVRFRADPL